MIKMRVIDKETFLCGYRLEDTDRDRIIRCIKSYPVEIERICEEFQLKVYQESLGYFISGKITKDGENSYFITVNDDHHPNRQRFTIAHELGHYLLHRDHIGDGITEDSLYRSEHISNALDVEANRFATDILMPLDLLKMASVEKGTSSIPQIADIMRVSEMALRIRLGVPVS